MRVKLPTIPTIEHTITRGGESFTFYLKPLPPGQGALMEMRLPKGKFITDGRKGSRWEDHTPGEAALRGNRYVYAVWALMLRDSDVIETPYPTKDGPAEWERFADAVTQEAAEAGLLDSDVVEMVNKVGRLGGGEYDEGSLGN